MRTYPDDQTIRPAFDLIDQMAETSPQALCALITSALDELRGAGDEGLLRVVAFHSKAVGSGEVSYLEVPGAADRRNDVSSR